MDMDSDPNGTAIGKLIAKMKKAKFSALRDIARNLGAKEETRERCGGAAAARCQCADAR